MGDLKRDFENTDAGTTQAKTRTPIQDDPLKKAVRIAATQVYISPSGTAPSKYESEVQKMAVRIAGRQLGIKG